MNKIPLHRESFAAAGLRGNQRGLVLLLSAFVIAGAWTFVSGISGPQAQRFWQAYLVNFVFWAGIVFGSVLFVALLNMCNAHWARPIKRLAEAPGAFIPVLLLLFWPLYYGREELFSWIHAPVAGKERWLNPGFLFARDGFALLLLSIVSLALVFFSVRGDVNRSAGNRPDEAGRPSGVPGEHSREWRLQTMLSPAVGICYALVLSLLSFDLIMSLDPHWISTLFGAYYFVGSFYTALALLAVLSCLGRRFMGMHQLIKPSCFHDLGKLLFGFCLVTGDFFYSQFLVIWYGNLPEETRYVILRVSTPPWKTLAWAVLIICFVIPFIILLSKTIKLRPLPLLLISCVILAGMWFERFLLIAPSLSRGAGMNLGMPEVMVSAGFLGAVALTMLFFLKRFPILPVSDPLFYKSLDSP